VKVNWKELFAQLDAAGVPDDFLTPEDRNQGQPRDIDHLFADWPDDEPHD